MKRAEDRDPVPASIESVRFKELKLQHVNNMIIDHSQMS